MKYSRGKRREGYDSEDLRRGDVAHVAGADEDAIEGEDPTRERLRYGQDYEDTAEQMWTSGSLENNGATRPLVRKRSMPAMTPRAIDHWIIRVVASRT